jgi:hypothetical protein
VSETEGPLALHRRLRDQFEAERARREAQVARLSLVQLALFIGSAAFAGSGLYGGNPRLLFAGGGIFLLFLIVRAIQARVIAHRERAQTRRDVHERHVWRLMQRWQQLPSRGEELLEIDHPYASDLDVVGNQSLMTRIDVTHTREGLRSLVSWLTRPAEPKTIEARQAAIVELAEAVELRQELEAAVLDTGRDDLDADPFLQLAARKGLLEEQPWFSWAAMILPPITLTIGTLGYFKILPIWAWVIPLALQGVVVRMTDKRAAAYFEALGSRRGFVEAFRGLMLVVEGARFEAPLLKDLQSKLRIGNATPSSQLRRLDRWVSLFEVRQQGLIHIVLNPLLLWDLNCLRGIESWNREIGRKCRDWFVILGEIEALSSLSVILHQDPAARLPEIAEDGAPIVADGLVHPLLSPETRVANDVQLRGPGTALIVTGSNMAGKSTLLRAIGVNVALALAGGPVVATRFRLPLVRLRASMRIADSLQSGASYFQAELARLRIVVEDAEKAPPILFLLDELLRGTNAKARHLGARAVVKHLLTRGATGMVATHDVALSHLETEEPESVQNVHFTDVIAHGVMTFDYRLRPGVVRTSNALRLLQQAGIDVEDDPHLLDEATAGVINPH